MLTTAVWDIHIRFGIMNLVSDKVDRTVSIGIFMPIPVLRAAEQPATQDWIENANRD